MRNSSNVIAVLLLLAAPAGAKLMEDTVAVVIPSTADPIKRMLLAGKCSIELEPQRRLCKLTS